MRRTRGRRKTFGKDIPEISKNKTGVLFLTTEATRKKD